jgi:hypothetical protein
LLLGVLQGPSWCVYRSLATTLQVLKEGVVPALGENANSPAARGDFAVPFEVPRHGIRGVLGRFVRNDCELRQYPLY